MKKIIAVAFLALLSFTVRAQNVELTPVPHIQFLSATGVPLAGGCVSTFQAGTNNPQATYTDSTGLTPNANPITLDSGGFANIWLTVTQAYKIQVNAAPSSGACSSINLGSSQWTVDNVQVAPFLSQSNTWTTLQIFNGGITVAGTLNSTGQILCKNFQNVRCAAGFPGVDWGTKVNNADADLGATAGEIWIDQSVGLTNSTAISLSANHTLRFIQGGIYQSSQSITVGTNSSIVGTPKGNIGAGVTFGGQVVLEETNSSNLAALVILSGNSSSLTNVVLYGNAPNNPTEGVGVQVTGVRTLIDGITVQGFMSHGIFDNAVIARVLRSVVTANQGDGIYAIGPNLSVSSACEFTLNGLAGTVTTSGVNVTETAGTPWSTSSTLVGTRVRIGTAIFTVASITDSTHLVLTTSAGNHVGFALNWGNGIELSAAPNARINQSKLTQNAMDGILGYGTTAAPTNNVQISSSFFQDQFQNDIEVIGFDPIGVGNAAFDWTIGENQFAGAQFRTPNNTWDSIILQDGGLHSVVGNSISTSPAPNQTRYGIHLLETTPNQALPSYIGENSFGNVGSLVATAVTAASEVGNVVTLTFGANVISAGQTAIVNGITPTQYNGTYYVIASTGTTISYFDPTAGLGAGTIFGTAAGTPSFGTGTFIDQNANASHGIAGQLQAPLGQGDIICASATNPPQWSDCRNGGTLPFTSPNQTGSGSGSFPIGTTASGFWIYGNVSVNVIAVTNNPTLTISMGGCTTITINLNGGPGVITTFFSAGGGAQLQSCTSYSGGGATGITWTFVAGAGPGTATFTVSANAKFVD